MRLIDADTLKDAIKETGAARFYGQEIMTVTQVLACIQEAPAAEAGTKGTWESMMTVLGEKWWHCSNCGCNIKDGSCRRYCPHCGAKMEDERDVTD